MRRELFRTRREPRLYFDDTAAQLQQLADDVDPLCREIDDLASAQRCRAPLTSMPARPRGQCQPQCRYWWCPPREFTGDRMLVPCLMTYARRDLSGTVSRQQKKSKERRRKPVSCVIFRLPALSSFIRT